MLTCSTQLSNYLSRIVDDTPIIIFFSKRKRSTKIFSLLNEFVYRFKFLSTYQNINFSRKLIQIHRRYAIPPRKNSLSSLIRKLEKNGKKWKNNINIRSILSRIPCTNLVTCPPRSHNRATRLPKIRSVHVRMTEIEEIY